MYFLKSNSVIERQSKTGEMKNKSNLGWKELRRNYKLSKDNQTERERDSIEQFWFSGNLCPFCFTVDELESNNRENPINICQIIPPISMLGKKIS